MAQVTYKGPGLTLSVPVRKRACEKGRPFPCSDPKELAYYKGRQDFYVVEPPKKKAVAKPPEPPKKKKAAKPPEPGAEPPKPPEPEAEPSIPPAPRRKAVKTGGDDA